MKRKLSAMLLFILLTQVTLLGSTVLCYQTSIPTPSVPTFSIRLVDSSIHITVKNQPYQASIDGIPSAFMYYVRVKGHFSMDWEKANVEAIPSTAPEDGSGYTELILSTEQYPTNAQVDVQVEAVYVGAINGGQNTNDWITQHSGWSNTQTVTILSTTSPTIYSPSATPFGDSIHSSTKTATDNPQPESGPHWNQMSIIVMVIIVVVVVDVLALSIYLAKKRHKKLSKT